MSFKKVVFIIFLIPVLAFCQNKNGEKNEKPALYTTFSSINCNVDVNSEIKKIKENNFVVYTIKSNCDRETKLLFLDLDLVVAFLWNLSDDMTLVVGPNKTLKFFLPTKKDPKEVQISKVMAFWNDIDSRWDRKESSFNSLYLPQN